MFDGEGSAGFYVWIRKKTGRQHHHIIASMEQNQRTLVDKFRNAVGVGKVYGPYASPTGTREEYRWQVRSEEGVQALLAMLWPWLGEYKREQLTQALLALRSRPRYATPGAPPGKQHRDNAKLRQVTDQLYLAVTDTDRRAAVNLL